MNQNIRDYEYLKFYIQLLELEIEALRSVLSEFEGDKGEYIMMHKAQAVDMLKKHLVRP